MTTPNVLAPEASRHRFRKLRIAFFATCGIACVLLCVLWVRSYWWLDTAHCPLRSPRMFIVTSYQGRLSVYAGGPHVGRTGWFPSGWGRDSTSVRNLSPRRGTRPKPNWAYDHNDGYGRYILFPHWLLALVMCATAAAFGVRSIPKRFSLRALLIATTVVALGLGLVIYATRG
jgi:hypothetical protein